MAKITDIKLGELNDAYFMVSFLYEGKNLNTDSLLRTSTVEETIKAIQDTIFQFEEKNAKNNFTTLKEYFEKKELEV